MAVEGCFSTLLLRDCKGKAAAHSLETSGSVFLRTCHPLGFTSRKKRRVCLGVLSEGLARAGVAAMSQPSLPLHPHRVRAMNCCPKISTQLPVQKGAEGMAPGAAGTHSLTLTPGFASLAGNAAAESTL